MASTDQYHWIITLDLPGRATATFDGVTSVASGTTRSQVYNAIRAELGDAHPELKRANTTFFALEPNEL